MMGDFLNKKINNLRMYIRFFLGFKKYLKEKISFQEVRDIIKRRLKQREENFLKIVKKGIFGYKNSPYLPLLKLSNCEYSDIEKLVNSYGLEKALKILKEDGIYFTIEEFKGKIPVIRKGRKFTFKERDFDNPYTYSCYAHSTGGTRSAGTRVNIEYDFLAQNAIHRGIITDIRSLSKGPFIILRPAFSGGVAMIFIFHLSKFGIYPAKWFSLIDGRSIPTSFRSKFAMLYVLYVGRLFGAKFPKPEFFDFNNMIKVVEYINNLVKERKACSIFTNVSSAVRICSLAREKGIDLTGVVFQGCGEPLTPTKYKEIKLTGAEYDLHYAFCEAGLAGDLCLRSSAIDDIHLFKDFLALISHKRKVMNSYVDAFLFTTLLPSAPKILINVESGDYGKIEERRCGCPYESLGFTTHIHDIRSFEKLTGEGMTFYGTGLIEIIEEVLPSKFGGNNLDYQLIEEESSKGITNLIVLVNPRVGNIDEDKLIHTVLDELRKGGDSQIIMAEVWTKAKTIKVRRERPILTKAGKQFPLHILKRR